MKVVIVFVIVLVLIVVPLGFTLPNERSFTARAVINSPPERVFATVTNISDQKWRSQVGEVEVVDKTEGQEVWIEKPVKGPPIKFRTKLKMAPSKFEIEIVDSADFGGHWIGTFNSTPDGKTEVEFTEKVMTNGWIAKFLSYAFFDVEDHTKTYIDDLKKEVEAKE